MKRTHPTANIQVKGRSVIKKKPLHPQVRIGHVHFGSLNMFTHPLDVEELLKEKNSAAPKPD